ncbi:hypothetical protein [Hymenobacter sp. BT730]|uniref:hypothetical protein n=1 Tax=Hymenobacter sp. BT730 TaxID=3063332 RepID=UPI0026E04819|nr:hypothetical protein [Hymenobacter sp. BT730]
MSNKLLVFLAGLLLVTALGSYVYYRRTVARVPVDAWALVPDDAVFVVATRDHPTLVRHLKETQLWDNLTALPYFQQFEENAVLLDSLTNSRNNLLRFLGRKTVLASVHVTGPGTFDILYQVPLNTVREFRQVRAAAEALGRIPRFQVQTREFHDMMLTDIRARGTGAGVTYFNYRNHLIISASPLLIEKVIARIEHEGQPSVAADFHNIDYQKLKGVDATLLVNYRQLPPFLNLFFRPELRPSLEMLTGLGKNGLLEMQLAGNKVVFNGFTNPEIARDALHQRLRGQVPQRLRMADILSLRTAMLLHLGIQKPASLRQPMPALSNAATTTALDSVASLLDGEVALCYLSTISARQAPARVALAHCADAGRMALALGHLRRAAGGSPSFERVGPYQLYQVGVEEVPARLLGPLFRGFGAGVVVQVGSFVAFAQNAAELRPWLQDVAAGKVWAKSPTQVALLEEMQPLARLSVIMDAQNSWNVLLRALKEDRRAGLLRNETLFKRFPQMALQLVPPADSEQEQGAQYFTQLLLRHPAVSSVAQGAVAAEDGGSLTFRNRLITPPMLVSIANARTPGMLVQDSLRVLHYITPENVATWSDTLSGSVVGPVHRLPVGDASGFLLATTNQLVLLDPQGRPAPHFPLNLPDSVQVSSLTPSPNQGGATRLLVGGGGGNFFLYDTNGNLLPNWQPKRLEFSPAAPPHYLSVAGSDVIVVLLENGYIFAFDRQGGTYPGFPISVGARLHTSAFVETGSTLQRTRLTVVTQQGERVQFNLSGYVLNRSRISTWSRGCTFRIIPDQQQRTYVVVRQEPNGLLTIFDAAGRRVVERRFTTSDVKPVQFFDFGTGRRLLSITEPGPNQVYLYNSKGKQLGGRTFPSSAPTIEARFDASTNSWIIYRSEGRALRRTSVTAE